MILKKLLENTKVLSINGDIDIDVTGICYDSRKLQKGDIFVAIPGTIVDGAKFIPHAIQNGASAIIHEGKSLNLENITEVIVPSARACLADISNTFFDYPSKKLKVVGITGTNGKTTTAYLIDSIFKNIPVKTGFISTIETKIGDNSMPSTLTTPESFELQKLFSEMVSQNIEYVTMEVSSHSLALKRVRGIAFDCAIYTNLSHDHLDFHGTLENYFDTKLKLFKSLGFSSKKNVFAVINIDDQYGDAVIQETDADIITYSLNKKASVYGIILEKNIDSMKMNIYLKDQQFEINTKLSGIFNAYNILASIGCVYGFGIDIGTIKKGIENLYSVPGRMQFVDVGQNFKVVIDFAHSPDSLLKVSQFLKEFKKNRIICVFGCTGDRDKLKRPIMGEIAAQNFDFSIITSDDPHNEDPEAIILSVEKGFNKMGKIVDKDYLKITDRKQAIFKAIDIAQKDDIVLIAGRGHEKFQEIKGVNIEIDDYQVAKEAIFSKLS